MYALLLFFLTTTSHGAASQCLTANVIGQNADITKAVEFSPRIFVGTVIKTAPTETQFKVRKILKGKVESQIVVPKMLGDRCAFSFIEGLTYLVFGEGQMDGSIAASTYGATRWIADSEKNLRWLDKNESHNFFVAWFYNFFGDKPKIELAAEYSKCSDVNLSEVDQSKMAQCKACESKDSRDPLAGVSQVFREKKDRCDACLPTLPFAVDRSQVFTARVQELCPDCQGLEFLYQGNRPVGRAEGPACQACVSEQTVEVLTAKLAEEKARCGRTHGDCRYLSSTAARTECDTKMRVDLASKWNLPWLAR